MLMPGGEASTPYEQELTAWESYTAVIMDMFDSLAPHQAVLDIGAGFRDLQEDRLVRLDVVWTPHADVLGDAHALPFRDEVFDVVMAEAVLEHLRDPFAAAREMYRVLKPGGQVLAGCNFMFPFHGFPSMYFCCTEDGLREVFSSFREIAVEVAPWQRPALALRALVVELVNRLQPQEPLEHEFIEALRSLDRFPVDRIDASLTQEDAKRIAAGLSFLGMKQPTGVETTVPSAVIDVYQEDARLRSRYPDPAVLVPSILETSVDSLMRWALTDGCSLHPAIRAGLDAVPPFCK